MFGLKGDYGMNADWFMDNESRIFTIVKGKTYPKLVKTFPDIFFTTSDESSDNPVFPTVYIHELEGIEQGITLERNEVNSITSTFEVKVSVDTKKADAKTIMKSILLAFKELGFNTTMIPITMTQANMYVSVARFRRAISSEDII